MRPTDPIGLTLADAAASVGCSTKHLTREIHAGRLPAKRLGNGYRIDAAALRDWFNQLPDAETA